MRNIQIYLCAMCWLLGAACSSQEPQPDATTTTPVVEEITGADSAESFDWTGFVPTGHKVLDTLFGYLNDDDAKDLLLLVHKENESELVEAGEQEVPRQLFILVNNPGDGWMLGGHSYYAVLQANMSGAFGGDPYQRLVNPQKGSFAIEHYGGSNWRWTHTTTFTYSPQDHAWVLQEELNEAYHTSDPEKVTTNRKTAKELGKILFDDYKGFSQEE